MYGRPVVDWAEAMDVLERWQGSRVIVVPFLQPGISLEPLAGLLDVDREAEHVVRLRFPAMAIALHKATFIEAGWVRGREGTALSIVQGGTRVDVFLDGDGSSRLAGP